MAAERLAQAGVIVTVVDRMPTPARKLLMAGIGGLNITHDEDLEIFLDRYGPARPAIEGALRGFPPRALQQWCAELGQDTFTGTSGRVFPIAMKASPLLRAWLARLKDQGVRFLPGHRWLGWTDEGSLRFIPNIELPPGATILALGGASWPRLGSDGAWTAAFPTEIINPLRPANCGFVAEWSKHFKDRFEGQPLKRIVAKIGSRDAWGDAVITSRGIEGSPFYAISAPLRDEIGRSGHAVATLDLRPDLTLLELRQRLALPRRGQSTGNFLRKTVGLAPVALGLIREHGALPEDLSPLIKSFPLRLTDTTGLARAISTAGGIRMDALSNWSVQPGVFVAGEMLDWEAPTGGYLLQASFSTGYAAGDAAAAWLCENA